MRIDQEYWYNMTPKHTYKHTMTYNNNISTIPNGVEQIFRHPIELTVENTEFSLKVSKMFWNFY